MLSVPTVEQIETLNAHGPYNHSVWTDGGFTLTHEEALAGRGHFLASTLRSVLASRFTAGQMASLSLLDVGCYDGWILHQLSDLPLRRLAGVEPREKNIRKGQMARAIFGIETRAEFRQGGIASLGQVLGGEQFDIVVATGLLHHVENPAEALRALRAVCRRLLFIETIALDSRHLSGAARGEIEPKDVVYFGRRREERTVGLSGQKLESSYYDGSAAEDLRVVSIPSLETLVLSCEAAGFAPPRIEVDPDAYRRAVWRDRRPFHALILTAEVAEKPNCGHGEDYERRLATTLLRRDDLEPLHRIYCQGQRREAHTEVSRAVHGLIRKRSVRAARECIERLVKDRVEREILLTIPHAPADKIAVEMGKVLLAEDDLSGAEAEFRSVTGRWNADWRSTYRAFHFLAEIMGRRGDALQERRYRDLLAVANARYPGVR